jgi:hypothetical protein
VAALAVAVVVAAALGAPIPSSGAGELPADPQVAVVGQDGDVVPVHLSTAEVAAERREPDTAAVVVRGRSAATELAQSVPKVGAPTQWSTGYRGAGRVVVVIDTGVASSFGGQLVGQACFAASQVGPNLVGHCGPDGDVTEAFDSTCFELGVCGPDDVLDPAAGRPCAEPPRPQSCAHGTAVAAVAARHEPTPGVAPDAGVYAIQVFEPTGGRADFVDILLALDHVADLAAAGLEVASVNLSLASSATYPSHCDSGPAPDPDAVAFRTAFQRLALRGIAATVATGNDASPTSIGMPACVSNAIAVGASDLDDHMARFGNRGPTVDLLAPGADHATGATDPMEIPGGPVTSWAGTSFSAPHVAGAFALLQPQYPKASTSQVLLLLQWTAVAIVDPETGRTYARLRLLPHDQVLPAGILFPTYAPVGGTSRGAVGDFDGDGFADVLAHGPGAATDRVSFGGATWSFVPRSYSVNGTYTPIVGNFAGSGADDILWYAPGSASDYLWTGSSTRTFSSQQLIVRGTYAPQVGNFDGDPYDDIAWYAAGSTADALWYGGPGGFTSRGFSVAGSYRVAVGDVNGDDRDDLVFHGPGAASDALWRGTATKGTWAKSGLSIGGTNTVRAADLDGDSDDDLLLYQPGAGADAIWRGGPGVGGGGATGGFSPLAISVNGSYRPSVGDLDGDGTADILWFAPDASTDYVWLDPASGSPSSRAISVTGAFQPLLGDLDADDGDDIVWFQGSDVSTQVWWSAP